MKNKTIVMTGALLIGGLLTFNSVAFADGVDAKTSASLQKPAQTGKAIFGKMDGYGHKGSKGFLDNQKQDWSTQLKELVAAGTITQAAADKMQSYITEQNAAVKAEMEKLQAMTPEQRKAYFDSKKTEAVKPLDMFSSMVEKGVITQQQSDAIKAKLQALHQAKQQADIKTSLDKLVQSKTITQEQADKITEYMTKQQAVRAAEQEKLKAMTKEELAAYFKSNPPSRTNMMSQLVTDKVLTQDQANAVEKALHPGGFSKGQRPDMQKRIRDGAPKL